MSNDQLSDLQQLQSPEEEQELQILEWVSKEHTSGTVVRKELINWFAERVHYRDGTGHKITSDFADEFLHRHPDLAGRLIEPSPPKRHGPNDKRERRAGDRLRERMERDRTRAMFGDNPPPARQPAPFPDGDIIYHCNTRYVIRHGNTITKLTTYGHGFGSNDIPNEALALRFIKAHTTIPVPEVISSDWDRVTMEYIEGQTLRQAWPVLTPSQRSEILTQLSNYIAQLRSLRGTYIGRMDGQGVVIPSIITRSGGPFQNSSELHKWLANPLSRHQAQSMFWRQITAELDADYPIVFTHADIAARNIMIRDGRIVAILDWEFAGWLPEYWEYVFALRGLDNIDWETLGQHLPSLFAKRYDHEYILMGFIMTLS
ncbi:hypothetical protein Daus18300_010276 [Diaporthe australafricana]|uniref:Aminoglycoside phosphotransferase domain-containing protein n=1 Tax=Diaporthe australafricana TaxID=127596 RepID=A0ABR3WAX4_9PEZI